MARKKRNRNRGTLSTQRIQLSPAPVVNQQNTTTTHTQKTSNETQYIRDEEEEEEELHKKVVDITTTTSSAQTPTNQSTDDSSSQCSFTFAPLPPTPKATQNCTQTKPTFFNNQPQNQIQRTFSSVARMAISSTQQKNMMQYYPKKTTTTTTTTNNNAYHVKQLKNNVNIVSIDQKIQFQVQNIGDCQIRQTQKNGQSIVLNDGGKCFKSEVSSNKDYQSRLQIQSTKKVLPFDEIQQKDKNDTKHQQQSSSDDNNKIHVRSSEDQIKNREVNSKDFGLNDDKIQDTEKNIKNIDLNNNNQKYQLLLSSKNFDIKIQQDNTQKLIQKNYLDKSINKNQQKFFVDKMQHQMQHAEEIVLIDDQVQQQQVLLQRQQEGEKQSKQGSGQTWELALPNKTKPKNFQQSKIIVPIQISKPIRANKMSHQHVQYVPKKKSNEKQEFENSKQPNMSETRNIPEDKFVYNQNINNQKNQYCDVSSETPMSHQHAQNVQQNKHYQTTDFDKSLKIQNKEHSKYCNVSSDTSMSHQHVQNAQNVPYGQHYHSKDCCKNNANLSQKMCNSSNDKPMSHHHVQHVPNVQNSFSQKISMSHCYVQHAPNVQTSISQSISMSHQHAQYVQSLTTPNYSSQSMNDTKFFEEQQQQLISDRLVYCAMCKFCESKTRRSQKIDLEGSFYMLRNLQCFGPGKFGPNNLQTNPYFQT